MAQVGSYLFVYGTLRPRASHRMARWLAERAGYVGPAKAPGRIYDLGSYPGMVISSKSDEWVLGDLYRIDDESIWQQLDRYEGCNPDQPERSLFHRTMCNTILQTGEVILAYVYVYAGRVSPEKQIVSGDYLAR